jgi:RNA polymerase sigma factor (sigma-70 family)
LLATDITEPTAEDRRQAVCMAMTWAPGLIRFAARYTKSLEDAEDAYQRAMEVALTSAPVTDPDAFVPWLHKVILREAAVLARARQREEPTPDEDLDATITAQFEQPAGPDAVAEWRERYRGLQDAWTGLTEAQKLCLMLRSKGVSRPEIQLITGFSERKVHRSISEGRARLTAWEVRMASGEECDAMTELIERVIDESASRRDRRVLSRHVGHCQACRARYRGQRAQLQLLGSLVPTVLVGTHMLQAGPRDPSLALTWWDRVSTSATARSAQAVQVMMDVPALASTKAGAGAIAAAAAGVVGTPMVIDAVTTRETRPAPIAQVVTVAPVPPASASTTPATKQVKKPIRTLPARTHAATQSQATVTVVTRRAPRVDVASTHRAAGVTHTTRRAATPVARPSRNTSPALEFGP